MRWPIRNQILLPLVALQLLVVVGVTWLAAWSSLRRVERDVRSRFQDLATTIQGSNFPLTSTVLEQMHRLSGADFLILSPQGEIQSSTLSPSETRELQRNLDENEKPSSNTANAVRVEQRSYLTNRVPIRHYGSPADVLILYPESQVQSARDDAIRGPVLLGLLTLALTTIAVIFVAQRIGKRIQAIERQVARVASGNFEPIPLKSRSDELRDLSASVNQMSVQLDRMASRIRETERAELVKQLAGGIAHQLRNSLTGARLALQLHRRRCPLENDESLSVSLHQLSLTEEQIRGLVALIRDEHRPRVAGSLSAIASEVAALVRPMCEHRQIRFDCAGPDEDLSLEDADQIRAAILNLCINAIEATSTGGAVHLRLEARNGIATIDVTDDGPGVTATELGRIFDPFHSTKADGMGLGLALVKQTAEDHGGSIQYLREGSTTTFRLTCRGQSGRPSSPRMEAVP
ncbi:sensor histidine kinase [Planctomicrobium sp. SH661]|uniref:sensor histidine kinase n=1 Tax=Planctomicrobium sp. SH661 TaxID=3448124 RepID=UPI003F5C503C